jgi:hypothetical protein
MGVSIGILFVFVGIILQGRLAVPLSWKSNILRVIAVPSAHAASMYIGGRFMVGLGYYEAPPLSGTSWLTLNRANITQGSAPLLIMELAYPQHRGKLTTL